VHEKYYIQIIVLLFFVKYLFLKPNREKFRNGNNLAQNIVLCGGGGLQEIANSEISYHYRNKTLPTIHRGEIGVTCHHILGGLGSSIPARYSGRTRF
jgi:hypothetical protein